MKMKLNNKSNITGLMVLSVVLIFVTKSNALDQQVNHILNGIKEKSHPTFHKHKTNFSSLQNNSKVSLENSQHISLNSASSKNDFKTIDIINKKIIKVEFLTLKSRNCIRVAVNIWNPEKLACSSDLQFNYVNYSLRPNRKCICHISYLKAFKNRENKFYRFSKLADAKYHYFKNHEVLQSEN